MSAAQPQHPGRFASGRVSADAAILLVARVVSAATTLVVLAYAGHREGEQQLAAVGVGLASGAILATVSDAAAGLLYVRSAAPQQGRDASVFWHLTALRLPLTVVAVAAAFPLARISPGGPVAATAAFSATALIVQQATELVRTSLVAQGRALLAAVFSIVENVGWLAVVLGGASLASFTAGIAAGVVWMCGSYVVGLVMAATVGGMRPVALRSSLLRGLAVSGAPFAAFAVLGIAYSRIDALLVSMLPGPQTVGEIAAYVTAVRLVGAAEYIPESLTRAVYPRLAVQLREGASRAGSLLRDSITIACALAVPVTLVLALSSGWLMGTLFGAPSASYGYLLSALSLVLPARFVGHLLGASLTAHGDQARRTLAVAAALVVTVVADLALIPALGATGAVIGALVAGVLVCGVYVALSRHVLTVRTVASAAWRPLVVGAGAAGLGMLCLGPLGQPAAAAVALIGYALALALVEARSPDRGSVGLLVGGLRRR